MVEIFSCPLIRQRRELPCLLSAFTYYTFVISSMEICRLKCMNYEIIQWNGSVIGIMCVNFSGRHTHTHYLDLHNQKYQVYYPTYGTICKKIERDQYTFKLTPKWINWLEQDKLSHKINCPIQNSSIVWDHHMLYLNKEKLNLSEMDRNMCQQFQLIFFIQFE